jgi:D-alanyl-D-alanine carboxypeptidase
VALNNHFPNDVVAIPAEAIKQAGDYGLFVGEKWKVADLAKLTLISSANDGAYTLATPELLEKINAKSRKLGAFDTNFFNFTGLDIEKDKKTLEAGAVASAYGVNLVAAYALLEYPEVFSVTTLPEINLTSESDFTHNFKNTNTVISKIPNLLFSKTGYTELAGGNLTVIFTDQRGKRLAVTVLGSTFDGRFTDMEQIVNILYNS